jgi:ABC-type multidrug transport system ATPase subunit
MIGETIRANLDPLDEYSEDLLDKALQQVNLDTIFCEDGLQTVITEAFTTGHKRLLCLARAILHKARIIVLEESTELTGNCESEQIIDQKLKSNSSDLTVVILTQRLSTLISLDRVLVVHQGASREFDAPFKLLVNQDQDTQISKVHADGAQGIFARMVKATGEAQRKTLLLNARQSYVSNKKIFKEKLTNNPLLRQKTTPMTANINKSLINLFNKSAAKGNAGGNFKV